MKSMEILFRMLLSWVCLFNGEIKMNFFMRHFTGILAAILILGLTSAAEAGRYFDSNNISQPPIGTGITFYVDGVNGNDSWNGRAPTYTTGTAGPFKTISKAVDRYAGRNVGGNTVLVKAGTYRERVSIGNVTGATSESTRFVLGSYGDGPVILDASNTSSLTWSTYSGNSQIYVADFNLTLGGSAAVPQAVVMDGNFKSCRPVQSLALVTSFGKWYYDATAKKIYVYTGGVDPTTKNIIVTKKDSNNVDYGIYITGDYVTIYGLTVMGASSYGIHGTSGIHTRVENCDVKYSGKAGIKLYGNYGELLKNHVHGNVLLNWPRGSTWDTSGGWPNGMTGSSYALISGNIVHDNGGEGIGSMAGAGGLTVEDNISHDNWSINIYLDNQPNDIVRRNLVYNTAFYPEDAMDANLIPAWTNLNKVWKRMFPEGVVTGDETASGAIATSVNHQIYDNLIINCYTGYSHYGQATGAGLRNFTIANNTIVMPDFAAPYGTFSGISIGYYAASANTTIKNNIIYGTNHGPLVSLGSATDAGIQLNNNLYYDTAATSPFKTGAYPSEVRRAFAAWKIATGQDNGSKFADPQFIGGADAFSADYYLPIATSPTIGMASTLSNLSTDFNKFAKTLPWTTGALEYGSVYGDTTLPVTNSFTAPAYSNAQTFNIAFTASDEIGGSGLADYCITTNNTSSGCTWSASAPTSYSVSADGSYTLYPWARDNVGNISAIFGTPRTVIVDMTSPLVAVFSLPATATSLTVPISSLTATDIIGVTGYLITEGSTPPSVSADGWSATVPTSITFSGAGSKTAYAWAKDANGNLSNGLGRTVMITLPDKAAPTVTAFKIPATATSKTITISSLIATDNFSVIGYLITESATKPAASASGWTPTGPTSFTLSAAGSKTIYAWAKDAAGNVSASRSAAITITLPDTSTPAGSTKTPAGNAAVTPPPLPVTNAAVTPAAPVFTISDALLALRIAVGTVNPTAEQRVRADVSPVDGIIDVSDALGILRDVIGAQKLLL